jgi:pimeloyl-ACP methyl ester carboxylesterase
LGRAKVVVADSEDLRNDRLVARWRGHDRREHRTMAQFTEGDVSLRYEDLGSGYPVLLLAPGGLNSTVEFWDRAPIDPLVQLRDSYRLIAMDQRNAGRSTGPFAVDDPWGSYVTDQLRLVDHLGIERFHVMGCCIGCSYALGLAQRAPERVSAAVLEQPIGIIDDNRSLWLTGRQNWANKLIEGRDDLAAADGEAFGVKMWEENDFVGAVTREFVRSCTTPLLVLPGVDAPHPYVTGIEVAELAPGAELVDPWRDTTEHVDQATVAVKAFLARHTPAV